MNLFLTFVVVSAFAFISTFSLTFQYYALYESNFRCLIANCESENDAKYESSFADFSIPFWTEDDSELDEDEFRAKECTNFIYTNDSICTEDSFDHTNTGELMNNLELII